MTKSLIRVDKAFENKEANNEKLIIVSNKTLSVSLIHLISLSLFLIFRIFFDFASLIFFKRQN